ncbi:replication-associated recombination protein A [Oceanicoccus sp. KOV_DT_Chl]|uniref:replication-associated recombination protein A n=1 Tax=Oceanicoccus sp. KOV_DT_Chl TaxID=1904639 RepID=UPI000C79C61B|nr:replication-associated recombination protein A [Oceanicoccus sp. KOV_DT_Chl]
MNRNLFEQKPVYQPLAAKMRPRTLVDYIGQQHILGPGKPLREALESDQLHSMVLWGPPGVGKTSLAKLVSELCDTHFIALSAVLAGVKDIRVAIDEAAHQQAAGRKTILFIDEVHRFNKSQQDAFLPFVEDGTVIFIGATTENPSFELNNALLSRTRVYKLRALEVDDIEAIIYRSCVSYQPIEILLESSQLSQLALAADGDARRALNLLELAVELAPGDDKQKRIDENTVSEVLDGFVRRFDKGGDLFYEQISALHKAVRGSAPDAALYWFCRMLDGGCDPLYIARRVVRMASEDIGNADPRALEIALNAWNVQERLGSPEGSLAIAQAVVYMASAAKSNAVYKAFNQTMAMINQQPSYDVPVHLRNAPTAMMKELDYGGEYRYAHDEPQAYAAGENYFPEELKDTRVYFPVDRGLEIKIAEKLNYLRELDKSSKMQRY